MDQHELVPVDHDPFADQGGGGGPGVAPGDSGGGLPAVQGEQSVLPPELANVQPQKYLEMILAFDQRLFNVELAIAQAVYEIRGSLAAMGSHVANLHGSHERLRKTIAAPKRIVRDDDGRPTGVVVDQSL